MDWDTFLNIWAIAGPLAVGAAGAVWSRKGERELYDRERDAERERRDEERSEDQARRERAFDEATLERTRHTYTRFLAISKTFFSEWQRHSLGVRSGSGKALLETPETADVDEAFAEVDLVASKNVASLVVTYWGRGMDCATAAAGDPEFDQKVSDMSAARSDVIAAARVHLEELERRAFDSRSRARHSDQ